MCFCAGLGPQRGGLDRRTRGGHPRAMSFRDIRPTGQAQKASAPPGWIPPQLSKLVEKAPSGDRWVHEIKFDGYRMAARIDRGKVQLLTRTGLDWTAKYPATAAALAKLPVKTAYIDGELCGVRPDGVTSFEIVQQAADSGGGALVYYAFDLLELDGVDFAAMALLKRKERLASILKSPPAGIAYSDRARRWRGLPSRGVSPRP
jgi:ATP-dependent DNA ligase